MGRGKRQQSQTEGRQRLTPLTVEASSSRVAPPVSLVEALVETPVAASGDGPRTPPSSNPAASARRRKEQRPELYCPDRRCLWMTGGGACPKHGGRAWSDERQQLANKRSRGEASPEEIARLEDLAGLISS